MRVSLQQIQQFIDFTLPTTGELVDRISRQLGGVERTFSLSERYDGAVIVRVNDCQKHPNADKLNICQIDDGSGGEVQVVCGAPNVKAGMFAVWLRPGSVVPSTAEDSEPFILGARELRGVMSNGMLASLKELGLGDSHDGIAEIDPSERTVNGIIVPGASFAEVFGLNDTIVEIENKMLTHRPDLFGQLGIAREIAGISGSPFTSPDWYAPRAVNASQDKTAALPLTVFNDTPEHAPRFVALAVKNVSVGPSPLWLQCALTQMGAKSINNVVDITNYLMLLTAQPTHAYDYDKLRGGTLGARMAKPDESVTLLNGKSYSLTESDVVIADAEGPVGLAGIIGGRDSEVSESTTTVVIEVATFNMYTLRKTSMRHGVFTDALTRFNKGQSPYQNDIIAFKLIELIHEVAGGDVVTPLYDKGGSYEPLSHMAPGRVETTFINQRLGTTLTSEEIAALLTNVEFVTESDASGVAYSVPFWRTDIQEPEDIVEEIGRLYGFDRLPRTLPAKGSSPVVRSASQETKQQLRQNLARLGASEILTYSFVNERLLKIVGQDPRHGYRLSNALSPDLHYYRQSLTPSLLEKVRPNFRNGFKQFALFEFGKTHIVNEMDRAEADVPAEKNVLAFVIAGDDSKKAAFFSAKRYFEQLISMDTLTQITLTEAETVSPFAAAMVAPYEPERSVALVKDGAVCGVIGEFKQQLKSDFKLPPFVAGFEIFLETAKPCSQNYKPLSRYPAISQDISVQVDPSVSYGDIAGLLESRLAVLESSLMSSLEPLAIYQPEPESKKTFTFRITLNHYEHTLTAETIASVIRDLGESCERELQAIIV